MHLQILRLELAILLDACDSPRWKLLLDGEQRRSLRCTLEDVLGDLAGAAHAAPSLPVEWAQNRFSTRFEPHAQRATVRWSNNRGAAPRRDPCFGQRPVGSDFDRLKRHSRIDEDVLLCMEALLRPAWE